MSTVLHVHHGKSLAAPLLQPLESTGVVVVDAPDDGATLPRLAHETAADATVISAGIDAPLRVARTIHQATPETHIVFVTDEQSEPTLRRELLLAPRIGRHWSVARNDPPAAGTETIRLALESTSRRRQLRTTLREVNVRLARQTPAARTVVSDHFMAAVLHQLADGVILVDHDGRVIALNEAARGIFGARLVRGAMLTAALPQECQDLATRVRAVDDDSTEELVLSRGTGHAIIEVRLTPVRSDQGKAVGTAILARDISERRTAEERQRFLAEASLILSETLDLDEAMQRLAEFLASELGGVVAVDIVEADAVVRRGAAIQGVDPALGARLREFPPVPTADHPTMLAFRTGEAVVQTNISEDDLRRLTRSEEHFRIIGPANVRAFAAFPLSARTELIGALVVARHDPFEPEEIQKLGELARLTASSIRNIWLYHAAEEGNRSKEEFLATLSHELRTPMTSILGWLQLLRIGDVDETTAREGLQAMEQSARIQAQLIDDLLDLSRIQMGKLHMQMTRADVNEVVRAAVDTVRPAAAAKGVAVHVEKAPDLEVAGDANRLQQVFWNLLSNGVKFTERGGAITVRTEKRPSAVAVTITDTGKGIDAAFLPYVFDRFRQADSAATRRFGGLGLGLSIVKQIVELHGGTVTAASAGEGYGSTFTVLLPIPAGDDVDEQTETASAAPALRGVSVLLVDSDAAAADKVAAALTEAGAAVTIEPAVKDALAALRRRVPDALVVGLPLTDDEGLELIRQVRNTLRLTVNRLPAVAIGSTEGIRSTVQVLGAGYQRCVRRPTEPAALVRAVADTLRNA